MLENLANIGEFIGALGVIVSIGYLAIQIRQNTKAVQSASYHQAAEQTWSALLNITGSESLANVLTRVGRGEALTEEEALRLFAHDSA